MADKKPKKPFFKRWWFIAICAFLAFGVICTIFESDESKQERAAEEAAIEQKKIDDRNAKKEAKEKATIEKKQKEATEKKAFDELPIDKKILKKNDNVKNATLDKNGVLTIVNQATSAWDENSIVTTYTYWMFEAMNDAFKDASVKEVNVSIETTVTDNKGNSSMKEVVSFLYTRETFNELNYDGFLNLASGQEWRIYNESDQYFIYPVIFNNIKSEYSTNLINGASKVPPVTD